MDLDLLWTHLIKFFPILCDKKWNEISTQNEIEFNPNEFNAIIGELTKYGISGQIYETLVSRIEFQLRTNLAPNFWKYFHKIEDNQTKAFFQFQYAVRELHRNYIQFGPILKQMELFRQIGGIQTTIQHEGNAFNAMLKVALLAELPANFWKIIYAFYSMSFKTFVRTHEEASGSSSGGGGGDEDFIDDGKCTNCEQIWGNCRCKDVIHSFSVTNQYLSSMNLLDRLAGHTLTKLIKEEMSNHVQEKCKGVFDISHIDELNKWMEVIVLNWLVRIFNHNSIKITDAPIGIQEMIFGFKVKLDYHLYETYAKTIINQFFNIIIDYPDSQPAIDDLKLCLDKIDLKKHLIQTLKQSLEKRLLHPGVNTSDILTGYVAAIRAIRHLDGTGVLLETITEPVKQYMRSRNDTVRCVVTALTEEGPTDLAEELAKGEIQQEETGNNDDELTNWQAWEPDPIDANPKKQNTLSRSADIISMVVNIYGSKELFVTEYRSLLADRLLNQLDLIPEKEIRNLELLKLRFGETLLHDCEVMLKDFSDSKRINAHIHSDSKYVNENEFEVSSIILSSQFWPPFKSDTLELPPSMKSEIERYTKVYEAYKGNRTLCWRPVIGRVNIEIQLANKTLEMWATPMQAVIIYHFQTKCEWTLDELCHVMKVPATVLRKRISFWQSHGLIREPTTDVFVLAEETSSSSTMMSSSSETRTTHPSDMDVQQQDCEEDESESAMASASDQREEELQVFWSYIVGMLTNLDSLPLERIHQMLKMFASHGPGVEFSQEELKKFLQRKVREHELVFTGGVYQLPK